LDYLGSVALVVDLVGREQVTLVYVESETLDATRASDRVRSATEAASRVKRARAGRRGIRQLSGVVIAFALWEIVSVSGVVNALALASPLATFQALFHQIGALSRATLVTLEAWAVGLAVALILGVAAGVLVGRSTVADAFFEWVVRAMRPLPSLALIPIAILVAGLGLKMTAGLVAFSSFWPIFINTRYGVQQVDNVVLETGQALGLRGFHLLRYVVLPAALPMIATGLQVAIGLALIVTVSVELVGGTGGLGQFVATAQQGNAISSMYAGIVVGGVVGWLLATGFATLVYRQMPWSRRSLVTQ
jgi:ABC-type nitrate/sulfonate/bicarbonate transport system permease component